MTRSTDPEVRIRALFISAGHDFKGHHGRPRGNHPIEDLDAVSCVADRGIEGDRYFGTEKGSKRQITFFDWEVVEAIREAFDQPELDPSVFRRNVLVEGVDLAALVGRTFELGGVAFEGIEPCEPCYWMDQAVAPGAEQFMVGKGGLRARILTSGRLRRGAAELTLRDEGTPAAD